MAAPADLAASCDLAFGHWNAGRGREARALFDAVLASDPNHAAALEGLAVIEVFEGNAARARTLIEQVLSLGLAGPETRLNLADILHRAGAYEEARALTATLLAETPDLAPAHYLMGQVFWSLDRIDEAFASYERARLDLAPELAGYLDYVCHERLAECDWRGYEAQAAFLRRRIRRGEQIHQPLTPILMLDTPSDLTQAARNIARLYPARAPLWTGQRRAHERLRIGYLTGEVFDHPVANLIAGVLQNHDRQSVHLTGFSITPQPDEAVRRRLAPLFDDFIDLAGHDDRAAAEQIFRRDIDILVTLSGHTREARPGILAFRPAPVQVNYLGYPGSMGAAYIDYLIADPVVVPEAEKALYAEAIAWLPGPYLPADNQSAVPPAPSRAEAGLPDGAFVFMAYHHPNKVGPAIFDVWMRILARTPGSVLWLPTLKPETAENLRREAGARSIDSARLIFAPRAPTRADHLARHQAADLFIDTLPFGAHSTASDALWAGLPVITCRGTAFAGRVCASLLAAAGLSDLIAASPAEFEDLAVALAADPARLAAVRRQVETHVLQSPLFDTACHVRHLEAAFQSMHAIAQAGQRPRAFAIDEAAGGFTGD